MRSGLFDTKKHCSAVAWGISIFLFTLYVWCSITHIRACFYIAFMLLVGWWMTVMTSGPWKLLLLITKPRKMYAHTFCIEPIFYDMRTVFWLLLATWQVCVEGNIASGKTHFLNCFKNNSSVKVSAYTGRIVLHDNALSLCDGLLAWIFWVFCLCVGHDHSLQGIEGQGHRSGVRVSVKGQGISRSRSNIRVRDLG